MPLPPRCDGFYFISVNEKSDFLKIEENKINIRNGNILLN
jgi:hypothetical protein